MLPWAAMEDQERDPADEPVERGPDGIWTSDGARTAQLRSARARSQNAAQRKQIEFGAAITASFRLLFHDLQLARQWAHNEGFARLAELNDEDFIAAILPLYPLAQRNVDLERKERHGSRGLDVVEEALTSDEDELAALRRELAQRHEHLRAIGE